jgi:hypothetical protein
METNIILQLEALKLLQEWSIWLITISSAFLGIIGFAFKGIPDIKSLSSAKYCIVFLVITVVIAVFLVGAIPAIIQKLQPVVTNNSVILSGNARGIYGYLYLDFIPLWLMVSIQRITFLIGLIFGARLVWLRSNEYDSSLG